MAHLHQVVLVGLVENVEHLVVRVRDWGLRVGLGVGVRVGTGVGFGVRRSALSKEKDNYMASARLRHPAA